jgi:hypothetical protein
MAAVSLSWLLGFSPPNVGENNHLYKKTPRLYE